MHRRSALEAVGGATPTMHCRTAGGPWAVHLQQYTTSLPGGQWALQLLQCTVPLPGGSGQWNSCNAPPHCLGAVGIGTPAMHCRTAWGQWAMGLLRHTTPRPWGQWAVGLPQCAALLPGSSGQWISCKTLPFCLGAVGSRTRATHRLTTWGVLGSRTPATHCLNPWGQCAATPAIHRLTARGSGQPNSFIASPACPGAVGSATSAMHCFAARGAVGSGTPPTHRLTGWGHGAAELLQRTASPPGGGGRWNSCYAPPLCLGAVGSGTPAIDCLTAWGQ